MTPTLAPPRYSSAPLPPYAYIPGQSPHPRTDPHGHSYGRPEHRSERVDAATGARNATYRRGVDLFNHGYFWEAHEAFETLWRGAGGGGPRPGILADFFQGLIQIAAAHVKRAMGQERATSALLDRGLARLAPVPSPYLGVEVRAFERATRAYFEGERADAPALVLTSLDEA